MFLTCVGEEDLQYAEHELFSISFSGRWKQARARLLASRIANRLAREVKSLTCDFNSHKVIFCIPSQVRRNLFSGFHGLLAKTWEGRS
jgi:hypothetical protein